MPKHRGTVYTVVRERHAGSEDYGWDGYAYDAIIGVYATLQRAEEVCGASKQALLDAGATSDDYRFSVKAVTFYDE